LRGFDGKGISLQAALSFQLNLKSHIKKAVQGIPPMALPSVRLRLAWSVSFARNFSVRVGRALLAIPASCFRAIASPSAVQQLGVLFRLETFSVRVGRALLAIPAGCFRAIVSPPAVQHRGVFFRVETFFLSSRAALLLASSLFKEVGRVDGISLFLFLIKIALCNSDLPAFGKSAVLPQALH